MGGSAIGEERGVKPGDDAEAKVSRFYNTVGWEEDGGVTEDARRWEDLRPCARKYVSRCRLRVLRHLPERGSHILDMASGPIQYPEYLEFSRHFEKRHCVDLSSTALARARQRIGDHGVFLQGSFLDLPVQEDFFDCAVSLHTIYHIDRDRQEEAVRKLLRATKAGGPVVVVYSNPDTIAGRFDLPVHLAGTPLRLLRRAWNALRRNPEPPVEEEGGLYFHAHPIDWWKRFEDVADVRILPWRSFAANHQRSLVPGGAVGERMLDLLFDLEDRYPEFFARHFQYPMIVLRKRAPG